MRLIEGKANILNLLYEFDDVFIHNRDKIANYDFWAEKINRNGMVAVLEDQGKNIGMAVFYANDVKEKQGYISLIGLKSEYQDKGLGKLFLNKIIVEMKSKGMTSVQLEVDDDNDNAKMFYAKYGFKMEEKREKTTLLRLSL